MTSSLRGPGKVLLGALALLAGLLCSAPGMAGVILISPGGGAGSISFFAPNGQSFTAEDKNVAIAFSLYDFNSFADPANSALTVRLLAGSGTGGAQLGAVAQTITPGTMGAFVDFDFSYVDLVVGQQYTALIEAQTSRWFLGAASGDVYAGGVGFVSGAAVDFDRALRVTPKAQVPEPASVLMVGAALALLAFCRRRRT